MFDEIFAILAGLGGLGGLISVIVNLLKQVHIVQDGTSDKWFQALNFLAFIAVAVVYWLGNPVDWTQVDQVLTVLGSVIGLVVQIVFGKLTYKVIKGAPIFGFTYSD